MIPSFPQRRSAVQAPVVSILVPVYNSAAYLRQAVVSVLGQTLADFEVIIADDASADDSWQIAQALAAADSRVCAVRLARNGGPAAARNRALALARGKWIAILDSDDLYHPDRLRRLIAHAEGKGADLVADDLLLFGNRPEHGVVRLLGRGRPAGWITLNEYLRRTSAWGSKGDLGFLKPVIRAEALRTIAGGYDERLRIGEDDDLVVRLLISRARYRLLPVPTYWYRKHDASITSAPRPEHLIAMVAGSERMLSSLSGAEPACRRACRRRLRSRRRALHFDRLARALKSGEWVEAITAAARLPSPLPLLHLPLRARMLRVVARFKQSRRGPQDRERTKLPSGSDPPVVFRGHATAANALALLWLIEEVWPLVRERAPSASLLVAGTVAQVIEPNLSAGILPVVSAPADEECVPVRPAVINALPDSPFERSTALTIRPDPANEAASAEWLASEILNALALTPAGATYKQEPSNLVLPAHA